MTREEWRDHLVRLGMGAIDRVFLREYGEGTPRAAADPLREAMTERMAQAAQAIVLDIEAARAKPDDAGRMERIDATARAIFAAEVSRSGYQSSHAAYSAAEALEAARAAYLERGR